jgi:hypothetical protein
LGEKLLKIDFWLKEVAVKPVPYHCSFILMTGNILFSFVLIKFNKKFKIAFLDRKCTVFTHMKLKNLNITRLIPI